MSQNQSVGLYFLAKILKKAGFNLALDDEESNVLEQEQSLFLRDFEKIINSISTETIFKNLKVLHRDENVFKKSLLPTLFKKTESDISLHQDSLIRLFLKINNLREFAINLLLEEITSTASEDENPESAGKFRLLLNPLRFLPYISNGDKLTIKLIDILDIAPTGIQLEILDSLPDIIPDNCYNDAADQLLQYLNSNENLTAAVIDCLNSLNLDEKHRLQIQDAIMSKFLPGSQKLLPMVLDFLVDSKTSNVRIMQKIRDCLDSTLAASNNQEKHLTNILVFNKLKIFARTKKQFAEDFINIINVIKQASDHKPIDLIILFVLHNSVQTKKRTIEIILRKRVKDGLLKADLINKLFNYLPAEIFKEYFPSFLELGCHLIKTSEDLVVKEFSVNFFKTLFECKHAETLCRREIIENLISVAVANDNKRIGTVLNIIDTLIKHNLEKVQTHTVLIMRLLEKVLEFDFKSVQDVYEILCTLVCGEDNVMSGLKDEIHMITRKQLSSSKKSIKYRGIIAAVVMARHIASNCNSTFDVTDEITSISDMPQGSSAREAAALLDLANASVGGSVDCMGLFYDQLAIMISLSSNIHPIFISWLYGTILKDFKKSFLTKSGENVIINEINLVPKYGFDNHKDMYVNIGPCTFNSTSDSSSSILLLPSHFRLLRMLNMYKFDKQVGQLEYLFHAPIISPDVDFDDLDYDQLKKVADCLFHSVNWLREIISGFILQKNLRTKSIKRLDQLIELEESLQNCLSRLGEYSLPKSYFDTLSQNKPVTSKDVPKPAKRAKSKEIINNDSIVSTANTQKTQKNTQARKKPTKASKEIEIGFREIDTDIIVLFKYPLEEDTATTSTQSIKLKIYHLKFLLKDFIKKLNVIILGKKTGLSQINMIKTEDMLKDCCIILPQIKNNFIFITKKLQNIEEDNENILTTDELDLQSVFCFTLKVFLLLFNWAGFQKSKNLELLRSILVCFQDKSQQINSVSRLIMELMNEMSEYNSQCTRIDSAIDLVKLLKCLNGISPHQQKENIINGVTKNLLSKRWRNEKGGMESGKNYLLGIDYLITTYLEDSSVASLNQCTINLVDEVKNLSSKDDYLETMPSIDKANFYIFYRAICQALHNAVKTEVQSLTNLEHLELWYKTVITMQDLLQIAKLLETKPILSSFLKKSIAILKIFLSHGMPIFEIMLRSHPDKVIEILKKMQTNTRFLHHLCCYSKLTKDSGLVPLVPQFKLTLETLIYRVKGILVANKCSEAFWMGNLKNRNIHGDDILTQSSVSSNASNFGNASSTQISEEKVSDDEEILDSEQEEKNSGDESDVYD